MGLGAREVAVDGDDEDDLVDRGVDPVAAQLVVVAVALEATAEVLVGVGRPGDAAVPVVIAEEVGGEGPLGPEVDGADLLGAGGAGGGGVAELAAPVGDDVAIG
ncbi:MAG TPA: hypothetical protein PKW35_17375, partial [Nannocystaceae bacterium]|nr:hypothetical protein [Nannocystaceae bacterium]